MQALKEKNSPKMSPFNHKEQKLQLDMEREIKPTTCVILMIKKNCCSKSESNRRWIVVDAGPIEIWAEDLKS